MNAKNKALRYLSRFSRTEKQVADYLLRKGFSPDDISATISYLCEHKFLNDHTYAESYVLARIRRADGPRKIRHLLLQKGIHGSLADHFLADLYPPELQKERVKVLIRKRKGGDRNSLFRFLASRGFPQYVMIQAFEEFNHEDKNSGK